MKHIQFLKTLKRLCFSGQLTLTEKSEKKWVIYFVKGYIVYATGGNHPVRRWRRNIHCYSSYYSSSSIIWERDLLSASSHSLLGWEYTLLSVWMEQKSIPQEQIQKIIFSTIVEVLFDITQAEEITEKIQLRNDLPTPLIPIDVEWAIAAFKKVWRLWDGAGLAKISPDQAPIICKPEQFSSRKLAQFYQSYTHLINGKKSLRDLSIKLEKDVVKITSQLSPLIDLGWINLIKINDLTPPRISRSSPDQGVKNHKNYNYFPTGKPIIEKSNSQLGRLIACVDDSIRVQYIMKKLLTAAGYQFLGIDDAMRAIGVLVTNKPSLIFLDLVMPQSSGYEICKQLRKLPSFQSIPIVILTGNDGFANRLHSNFVGASDFLSKPLNAEKLLGVIDKHLKQSVV